MSVRSSFHIVWNATCRALMPPARKLPLAEQTKRTSILSKLSGECVYCGDRAQTTDHFRPVIGVDGMPTGYCNDAWNVVPCCVPCNSSKSNDSWRTFMKRTNGKAPISRGVAGADTRFKILESFDRVGRKHAQKWDPADFVPQLLRLRRTIERALDTHSTRTLCLKRRIRARHPNASIIETRASKTIPSSASQAKKRQRVC